MKCECKMVQNGGGSFTHELPPPITPPKKNVGGLEYTPSGQTFFQKPHRCVFKMMSATTESYLGMYVGAPRTPPLHCGPPSPLRTRPPPPKEPKNFSKGLGSAFESEYPLWLGALHRRNHRFGNPKGPLFVFEIAFLFCTKGVAFGQARPPPPLGGGGGSAKVSPGECRRVAQLPLYYNTLHRAMLLVLS